MVKPEDKDMAMRINTYDIWKNSHTRFITTINVIKKHHKACLNNTRIKAKREYKYSLHVRQITFSVNNGKNANQEVP